MGDNGWNPREIGRVRESGWRRIRIRIKSRIKIKSKSGRGGETAPRAVDFGL
jgi:hypothetical protein